MKKSKTKIDKLMNFIISLVVLGSIIVSCWAMFVEINKIPSPICNITSYEQFLDKVQQDCGATYFVNSPYTTNNEWKIFKQVCNADGYCKYEYVSLKECLK